MIRKFDPPAATSKFARRVVVAAPEPQRSRSATVVRVPRWPHYAVRLL